MSSKLLKPPKVSLPRGGMATALQIDKAPDASLVHDEYSNKYYGNLSYERYVQEIQGRQKTAELLLKQQTQSRNPFGNFNAAIQIPKTNSNTYSKPFNFFSNRLSPAEAAQKTYDEIMSFIIPDKADYIQSNDVIKSYKAYGSDWDTYFEGNYKNPRIAEENKNRNSRLTQQNKQRANWYNSMQELEIQNSSIPTSKKAKGTGIVAKADIFSGGLEAGLGV